MFGDKKIRQSHHGYRLLMFQIRGNERRWIAASLYNNLYARSQRAHIRDGEDKVFSVK
jgi:hypothetical protein